jgi:hypothetical protein
MVDTVYLLGRWVGIGTHKSQACSASGYFLPPTSTEALLDKTVVFKNLRDLFFSFLSLLIFEVFVNLYSVYEL